MIVFNGIQVLGLLIFLVLWVIYGTIIGIRKFNTWRKTGFCRHEFKLYETRSSGRYHWYKCDKCGEKRLK